MKLQSIGVGFKKILRDVFVPFAEYDDLPSDASGDEGSLEHDEPIHDTAPSAATPLRYEDLQTGTTMFRVLVLNPAGNKREAISCNLKDVSLRTGRRPEPVYEAFLTTGATRQGSEG